MPLDRLKRVDTWLVIVGWSAYLGFVAWTLTTALLGATVFIGTDQLTSFAPWSVTHPGADPVVNRFIGDTIDSMTPSTALLSESIRNGDPAYWNPFSAGGVALGALPDYGLFSPLSLPWLVFEPQYAPGVVKLLEFTAIGLGMALLGRRWKLNAAAAPLMALAFASSGFMVAWTNWPQTRVAALLPLLVWAVEAAVASRRVRDAVPISLVLASMLLGGFPAIVGYAAYLLVPYAIVRLIALRATPLEWLRAAVIGIAGALVAVLATAWQLLPFVANASAVIDFDRRAQGPESHLDALGLATLVAPDVFGNVSSGDWGPQNPIERFVFAGAAMIALAVTGIIAGRQERQSRAIVAFSTVALAICVIITYFGGPLLEAMQQLPVFSNNPVGRVRVIIGLLIALLVGFGVDHFARVSSAGSVVSDRTRIGRWLFGLAITGFVGIGLAWVVRGAMFEAPAPLVPEMRTSTIIALTVTVAAIAAAAVGLLARRHHVVRAVAVTVLAVIGVAQAGTVTFQWWPRSAPDTFYAETETHEFLEDELGHERVSSIGLALYPGTSTFYGLRQATGHSFHAPAWKDMLLAADPNAMASPTFSSLALTSASSPILDRLSVRYLGVDPAADIPGTVIDAEASDVRAVGDTRIEGTGPIRGVVVDVLAAEAEDGTISATLSVEHSGTVLDIPVELRTDRVGPRHLAVPGLEALAADARWAISLTTHGSDALSLDDSNGFVTAIVRPVDDGLRIVHAGDATLYERTTALSRFRWSDAVEVVTDPTARLEALAGTDLTPTTVVLSEADAAPPTDAGSSADITVVEDGGDRIVLDVTADGAGVVTVADSLQLDGWEASIDGNPADLIDADHALVAVAVADGEHRIELRYTPPGLEAGAAVSITTAALAVAALLALGTVIVLRRRRRVPSDREVAAE